MKWLRVQHLQVILVISGVAVKGVGGSPPLGEGHNNLLGHLCMEKNYISME